MSSWSGLVTPEVRLCPNWIIESRPGMGPGSDDIRASTGRTAIRVDQPHLVVGLAEEVHIVGACEIGESMSFNLR
jgi:hypothetical protein